MTTRIPPPCPHRFDGLVDNGDLAQFQALPTDPQVVICLDSPGGSFMEGIRIGAYMREAGLGTRLEQGALCESACSILFMSGSYIAEEIRFGTGDEESWQLGPKPWRTMHPSAQFGLHAPRLVVPTGQYDQESVTRAYDVALLTLSEFSRQLMQTGPSDAILFNPDLFSEMIATPHDTMFYIDTVDKAGRYAVEVGPVPPPTDPDAQTLITACATFYGWAEDLSAATYADAIPGAKQRGTSVTLSNGLPCDFEKGGQATVWKSYLYDVPDITFYDPAMPLTALAR
jgi:hypothetical protein